MLSETSDNASDFLRMSTGGNLNAEMLKCVSIGKACAKAYFRKFYIDSQNVVLRTENEMGMGVIHGTAQRVKETFEKTSTGNFNRDTGAKYYLYKANFNCRAKLAADHVATSCNSFF